MFCWLVVFCFTFVLMIFFFFKQKTAYEMRISDWSSDVCSSDLLGGAIALLIAGYPLSLPVFIGILMLLGIVGKKSILLIDFAIEAMAQGVPRDEAILDAGHKRAQPILMTTVEIGRAHV